LRPNEWSIGIDVAVLDLTGQGLSLTAAPLIDIGELSLTAGAVRIHRAGAGEVSALKAINRAALVRAGIVNQTSITAPLVFGVVALTSEPSLAEFGILTGKAAPESCRGHCPARCRLGRTHRWLGMCLSQIQSKGIGFREKLLVAAQGCSRSGPVRSKVDRRSTSWNWG